MSADHSAQDKGARYGAEAGAKIDKAEAKAAELKRQGKEVVAEGAEAVEDAADAAAAKAKELGHDAKQEAKKLQAKASVSDDRWGHTCCRIID
ncbi:MAG: hypothetical protein ACRYGR_01045 [Janthinobacterium lividum]